MELYIKQKVFSFGDKFSIFDEAGNEKYYVKGEVFSFGKKLHVYDTAGGELLFIQQKLWSFLPKYHIYRGETKIAEVVKEFTFFRHEYTVSADGACWKVHGDFLDHEYEIGDAGRCMVTVSKQWFTWGDTYKINILPGVDVLMALGVVLVIDACLEAEDNGKFEIRIN